MKHIRHEIEIAASPEHVWNVLTDFAAYPEWNPFIRSIEGKPQGGTRLRVRIEPPGSRAMSFRPTVLVAERPRSLQWLGRLFLPRVFDGEHRFRIDPIDEGRVCLVQEETVRGLLVPFVGGALERTERGFAAMNEALKARAEGSSRPPESG